MTKLSGMIKAAGYSGKRSRVVFVAYERFLDWPVFDTQVVAPMAEQAKRGSPALALVAFERADRFLLEFAGVFRKGRSIRALTGARAILLPRPGGLFGLAFAQVAVALIFLFLRSPLIFHCRGAKGAYVLLLLKRLRPSVRVIFDVRGIEPEEFAYSFMKGAGSESLSPRAEREFRRLSEVERSAVRAADFYFCVSESLKAHMVGKYGVRRQSVEVVPCGVSEKFSFDPWVRATIRRELGLEGAFVFIYVGSTTANQMMRETLWLFEGFRARFPDSFLIALVHEVSDVVPHLKRFRSLDSSVLLDRVANEKIPELLNAADFGMLLMEGGIQNKVRAPIKFSEYMCCGLPVITTDAAGDAKAEMERLGVGVVLPSFNIDASLVREGVYRSIAEAKLADEKREDLSRTMRDKYRWSALVEKHLRSYRALVERPSSAASALSPSSIESGLLGGLRGRRSKAG